MNHIFTLFFKILSLGLFMYMATIHAIDNERNIDKTRKKLSSDLVKSWACAILVSGLWHNNNLFLTIVLVISLLCGYFLLRDLVAKLIPQNGTNFTLYFGVLLPLLFFPRYLGITLIGLYGLVWIVHQLVIIPSRQ